MESSVLQILEFRAEHQPWFEKFNREWIEKHFWMEPIDIAVLGDPFTHIIDKGGMIFMAKVGEYWAGTVAIRPTENPGTVELTKMAVTDSFQGKKIGRRLAERALDWAVEQDAKKVLLNSNTKLPTAIFLYRNLGFIEVPLDGPYKRSDIKMELNLSDWKKTPRSMEKLAWFDRQMTFGFPIQMLPFFLERLEGTLIRVQAKVKGHPDEVLSAKHGEKWSVKQNIGHLSEVDGINNRRLDEMMSGAPVLSPAVFEPQKDYNRMPIADVIDLFNFQRQRNLAKYHLLRENELGRSSLHPRLKVQMTPVDLAWFDAEHDDHHLVTINELLKINSPVATY
jgi:GNAT superfamily N-acetyltransferase